MFPCPQASFADVLDVKGLRYGVALVYRDKMEGMRMDSRVTDISRGVGEYGMVVCCEKQHKTIITTSPGNWKGFGNCIIFPATPAFSFSDYE